MSAAAICFSEKCTWKGRDGWRLVNGAIELVTLTHGGHLASLKRYGSRVNLLWEAPWKTIEPDTYREARHARAYGTGPEGRFLSGFTGHACVLGYFGMPSESEARLGLPLHGEPASSKWRVVSGKASSRAARVVMDAESSAMGLRLRREIVLAAGEPWARIAETVTNERTSDVFFQWVQHATFGEPLLAPGEAHIAISGSRAATWPLGYEGKALLADDRRFRWPMAPLAGGGSVDLSRGFVRDGRGFVASVQVARNREHGVIAVSNPRLGLAAGYIFPARLFPWVAVWEENRTRDGRPWNGVTRARGLEFGSSPLPLGLAHAVESGAALGSPTVARIGARETLRASYIIFAAGLPQGWTAVRDARFDGDKLHIFGAARQRLRLGS